jgi:hypothetical protein
MKKSATYILVGVLVLIVLLSVGGYLLFHDKAPKLTDTSEDKQITLTAIGLDQNGNPITSGTAEAIIGGSFQQLTYYVFLATVTNTGNYTLYNVDPVNPADSMGNIFSNSGSTEHVDLNASQTKTLRWSNQSCSTANSSVGCDTNELCVGTPLTCAIIVNNFINGTQPTKFTISSSGDMYDALGNLQANAVISDPATLSITFLSEACSDGTPINTCNPTNKPKYCQFTTGSAPTLVDKSPTCGCPANMHVSGQICVTDACADGTPVNSCSTITTGSSGAFNFCKPGSVYEQRCNQCGAKLDYYGNPKLSCSPTSGEPSTAVYRSYTGSLSTGLGSK